MVLEGVFEEFPKLRVLLVETGFAWAPALCWRLDQHWERMRDEVPHVKRTAVRICARTLLVFVAADG